MSILLDTNILLRMAERAHPQNEVALRASALLLQSNNGVCIAPQVLYEFWVVATRPVEQNGLGFATATADVELRRLEEIFVVLNDTDEILPRWRQLVVEYDVKGKSAHDARLVAAMMVHEITSILTFNKSDFLRYQNIRVVTPDEVNSSAPQL